jgi:hypothetical protein
MQFLLPSFNKDILFKVPLVNKSVVHSHTKLMHGMDKHHDSHVWTKTITSHIKNDMNLTFRTTTYVGHLRCENQDCKYTSYTHCTSPMNVMEWDGFTPMIFAVGQLAPDGSTFVCKICKVPPICIATYGARSYYVFGTANMTHACLHLGLYKYPVKAGENKEFKKRICTLIGKQVEKTPKATNSAIVMEATKELVGELLLDLGGAPARKFDLEKLILVLDKCKYMSLPNLCNNVTVLRYIQRYGVMDGITMLRGCSC